MLARQSSIASLGTIFYKSCSCGLPVDDFANDFERLLPGVLEAKTEDVVTAVVADDLFGPSVLFAQWDFDPRVK